MFWFASDGMMKLVTLFVAVVVAETALRQNLIHHTRHSASFKGLQNIPFDSLLMLSKMASTDGLPSVDLEAGGALMQSTQFEMDVHKKVFATLLLAKPDLPAAGKDILATTPDPNNLFAQRTYNRWLAPLVGDADCVNCLDEAELSIMQF